MTSNQIAYWQLEEAKRANRVKEAETERGNRAQEQISSERNAETERHNRVSEPADYMSSAGSLARGVSGLLPFMKAASAAKTAKDIDWKTFSKNAKAVGGNGYAKSAVAKGKEAFQQGVKKVGQAASKFGGSGIGNAFKALPRKMSAEEKEARSDSFIGKKIKSAFSNKSNKKK